MEAGLDSLRTKPVSVSVVSGQLSDLNSQLSDLNSQLSALNSQLSVVSCPWLGTGDGDGGGLSGPETPSGDGGGGGVFEAPTRGIAKAPGLFDPEPRRGIATGLVYSALKHRQAMAGVVGCLAPLGMATARLRPDAKPMRRRRWHLPHRR